MTDDRIKVSIKVKHMADGWWHWQIVSRHGGLIEHSRQTRRTRRAAIRAARKRLAWWERVWAEEWEDA